MCDEGFYFWTGFYFCNITDGTTNSVSNDNDDVRYILLKGFYFSLNIIVCDFYKQTRTFKL